MKEWLMLVILTVLTRASASQEPAKCRVPCSNMYKSCSGVCMKKRQHAGDHRCSHCGYTWPQSSSVTPAAPAGEPVPSPLGERDIPR